MHYQENTVGLAARRSLPRNITFVQGLQGIASCLLMSVSDLDETERSFLHGVKRPEGRVQIVALQRLIEISARSHRPAHREQLAELVRAHTIAADGTVTRRTTIGDVLVASDLETEAQGPADVAIRELEQHPSAATKARAEETLVAHQARIRKLIDVVQLLPIGN